MVTWRNLNDYPGSPSAEDVAIAKADYSRTLRLFISQISIGERRALLRMLTGHAPHDAAEERALQRARKKLSERHL